MTKHNLKKVLTDSTTKLAGIYLAIIMLMSIGFSVVFYDASTRQLNRPFPPEGQISPASRENTRPFNEEVRVAVEARFSQAREDLLMRLIWINFSILVTGSIISYFLARRSLKPLEEAMDAQSQFVSDASHELRTPLTILQTTNEVALRKRSLTDQEARDLITHNVQEVKKLRELSDSLLSLLKTTNKEVTLSKTNLQDVVSDSLQNIVAIAQQKNITIEDSVPKISLDTNRLMLSRIIVILLDNAVKYSKDGTTVKITAKKADGKVNLNIIDQGIGIKASDLPHIFHRFYRADKSRSVTDAPGYGLGLSIADKVSKQLHAKLKVESKIGEGSIFTIILPSSK